uniref:Uncharacterized protein n=1 Tax=Syphacia muris TaxID=451379 RepID=A0A0N5AQR5_9BILA
MYDERPRREHHSHHRSRSPRSSRSGSDIWRGKCGIGSTDSFLSEAKSILLNGRQIRLNLFGFSMRIQCRTVSDSS